MKILIIDNSAMNKKGGTYCTNSLNGLFITDLIECENKISYFQFAKEINDSISSFNLEEIGVKCYPLKLSKNKILNYLRGYFKIISLILKHDFIYFYYPTSFRFATIICWFFRRKYGLYIRGMQGLNDKISKWNYEKAYTVFTVSDYFTSQANKITNSSKANTIRPMIPFTDKDVVTDRVYTIKQKFNILFLGRLDRDKGIAELLRAVEVLKEKEYNFELNLVGDGGFMPEVKRTVKDFNIEDVVNIRGAVFDSNKIKEYYAQADVYVLPTYHEGFPRTLYEAMIFGTPIITTFVGGIPALMKNEFNCIEIKPKSVDSIIKQMEFAINNYDKMIEYAKSGTQTVLKIVDSNRLTHAKHLNKILKNE